MKDTIKEITEMTKDAMMINRWIPLNFITCLFNSRVNLSFSILRFYAPPL
jgi:hypothetical protein